MGALERLLECLNLPRVNEVWVFISHLSSVTPVKKVVLFWEGQQSAHQLSTMPFFRRRFQSGSKHFPGNPHSIYSSFLWERLREASLHQFWFSDSAKETLCTQHRTPQCLPHIQDSGGDQVRELKSGKSRWLRFSQF